MMGLARKLRSIRSTWNRCMLLQKSSRTCWKPVQKKGNRNGKKRKTKGVRKEEEKANRLIVSEEENNLPSSFVLFVEYRLTWSALGGCGSNEYEYNKETPNRSMWTRVRAILCYGSVFKSIWSFHFSVSTFIH